jgi:hypothetical protein
MGMPNDLAWHWFSPNFVAGAVLVELKVVFAVGISCFRIRIFIRWIYEYHPDIGPVFSSISDVEATSSSIETEGHGVVFSGL